MLFCIYLLLRNSGLISLNLFDVSFNKRLIVLSLKSQDIDHKGNRLEFNDNDIEEIVYMPFAGQRNVLF